MGECRVSECRVGECRVDEMERQERLTVAPPKLM